MNEIALGDSTGHGEVLPKEERTPESHKPFSGIRAWFAEKLEALSLRSGDPKRLPTEEEMDRQTEDIGGGLDNEDDWKLEETFEDLLPRI